MEHATIRGVGSRIRSGGPSSSSDPLVVSEVMEDPQNHRLKGSSVMTGWFGGIHNDLGNLHLEIVERC